MPYPIEFKKITLWQFLCYLRRDPLQLFSRLAQEGNLIQLPSQDWFTHHPELTHHILVEQADRYSKEQTTYFRLQKTLGSGLLTESGEAWKSARPHFQSAFKSPYDSLLPTLDQFTQTACQLSSPSWADLMKHFLALSASLSAFALFGVTLSELEAMQITEATLICNEYAGTTSNFHSRWSWKRYRFERELKRLNELILSFRPRAHSLGLLVDYLPPEPDQALNQMKNFYIAGFETTGTSLTWILYTLSQSPEWFQKVQKELTVASNQPLTVDLLDNLPLTFQVIQETQRLYPPIWIIHRRALMDNTVGSHVIQKDQTVYLCPYVLHRHPDYWADPDTFNPNRFSREALQERPKSCFIPYGLGPRVCIAKSLSLLFIKLVLLRLLPQLSHLKITPPQVKAEPWITLKPKKKLSLVLP